MLLAAVGAAEAKRLRDLRAADKAAAEQTPSQEEILADLKETAQSMPPEELEALLAAMKAMREERVRDLP